MIVTTGGGLGWLTNGEYWHSVTLYFLGWDSITTSRLTCYGSMKICPWAPFIVSSPII